MVGFFFSYGDYIHPVSHGKTLPFSVVKFRNYDQVRIPDVVPLDRIIPTPHSCCHLTWIASFRLFSKSLSNIHLTGVGQDGNQNGVPRDLKPSGCLRPIHPVFWSPLSLLQLSWSPCQLLNPPGMFPVQGLGFCYVFCWRTLVWISRISFLNWSHIRWES